MKCKKRRERLLLQAFINYCFTVFKCLLFNSSFFYRFLFQLDFYYGGQPSNDSTNRANKRINHYFKVYRILEKKKLEKPSSKLLLIVRILIFILFFVNQRRFLIICCVKFLYQDPSPATRPFSVAKRNRVRIIL